jgi:hypothetical protein
MNENSTQQQIDKLVLQKAKAKRLFYIAIALGCLGIGMTAYFGFRI